MRPDDMELTNLYKAGKITRREFIRMAALLGLSASSISAFLAACAPKPTAEPTAIPTEAPVVPTEAPTAAPTAAPPPGGPVRGGTLKHALFTPGYLDPAFLSSLADDEVGRQWHDFLVYLGEDNLPDPDRSLATSWEGSTDGTVWTFELRQGVTFHNGKDFTAEDVVFTFNRLRDPEVGGATVTMYANIKEIEALDDYHVRFTLEDPNPDFPIDMGDYHAHIMDPETKDFNTEFNGTGPWMIEEYLPEERLVFKRNPNYWMIGEDGQSLPYMDGMEYIFIAEYSAQVEALRGGQVDWLCYVPPEYVAPLEADPNIVVDMEAANDHYCINMRSDKEPFNDNRVRQAIKLATDRSAMLESVALGYGVTGRDTPIGPSYGDYYLDVPELQRDVEGAKALLAEAGYPDGLEFELTVMDTLSAAAIATVWKEQLAEAGITANIEKVPVDVFYTDLWLECDSGIVDWGGRAYPQPYLMLAYMCDSPWNSTHLCDEELDELALAAAKEMDHAKRVELYHKIQEIFIERGGMIVPYFFAGIIAYRTDVKPGLAPCALTAAVDFRRVWLES